MILTDDVRPNRGVGKVVVGTVLGLIAGLLAGGPLVPSLALGLMLGVWWRGVSVTVPGADPTHQVTAYARPAWFRWSAVGTAVVLAVVAVPGGSDLLIFARVVLYAIVIGATVAYALRLGTPAWWPGHTVQPGSRTDEQRVLDGVAPTLLHSAGLTLRSRQTGLDITPTIPAKGLDERNLPFFHVQMLRGHQTVADYEKAADRLASGWGVPRVTVTSPETGMVRITAHLSDSAIIGDVIWRPAAPAPIADYVRALPMGADVATGDEWLLDLAERNFVVGGLPGSGKSSFGNGLLAHLARHPHVRIAFLDLKRGAEVGPWRPRVDVAIDNADGDAGTERALAFIGDAVRDMAARYQRMIAAGVTNAWTEDFLGPDEPVKLLVVDECSELFKTSTPERAKLAARCIEELKTYVQQGRAAGYVLVMTTQYPKDANLPTDIRENASDAMAFRVKTEKNSHAIFGWGYIPDDVMGDPTAITTPGEAVVLGGDGEARRVRMAWLDKAAKLAVIQESAGHRAQWLDAPPPPEPAPAVALTKPEPEPPVALRKSEPEPETDTPVSVADSPVEPPPAPRWGV